MAIPKPRKPRLSIAQYNTLRKPAPMQHPLFSPSAIDRVRAGASPVASSGGGGGGSPYGGILSDYLNQARADTAAESAADRGGMINALRQYVISYGASPNFDQFGGLGKDAQGYLKEALDPNTLALAQKSEAEGLSSHARMSHANDIENRRIPATLAGRGLLRSGQTGHDLSEQALSFKQAGYDMLSQLLQGITGSVSGFQNAERERQRALAEQEMQAAMQAAGDYSDSYMDTSAASGPGATATNRGTPTRPKTPPRTQFRGFFGNRRQTQTALRNRMRSGRM